MLVDRRMANGERHRRQIALKRSRGCQSVRCTQGLAGDRWNGENNNDYERKMLINIEKSNLDRSDDHSAKIES
jgi:hypothetical protein